MKKFLSSNWRHLLFTFSLLSLCALASPWCLAVSLLGMWLINFYYLDKSYGRAAQAYDDGLRHGSELQCLMDTMPPDFALEAYEKFPEATRKAMAFNHVSLMDLEISGKK